MKAQNYNSGDIIVCIRDCRDYGPQNRAYKGDMFECVGVYSPTTGYDKVWTAGIKGWDFIVTRNNFRKATEQEAEQYRRGFRTIGEVNPLIFN